QLLPSPPLELLAIDLDVFLGFSSDQSLVGQHLQRIERFSVTLDHSPPVATVQPDHDLRFVLLGPNLQIELGQLDDAPAPRRHLRRRLRLRRLLRYLFRELGEVAGLKRVFRALLASSPSAARTFLATTPLPWP